jgi:hypothetical protein
MRYLLLMIGIIVLTFFGLPDFIIYSKTGFLRWTPYVLVFIVIPFLLYKTLKHFQIKEDYVLGITIISPVLLGPLLGLWIGYLSTLDIEKNEVIKIAIVKEKWYSTGYKGNKSKWLFKAKFKVDNIEYSTFSHVDKDNSLNLGDTVWVRYSKNNPENNDIIEK